MVQAGLAGRAGIRAPREQVLAVLRLADPAAVAGRLERIRRRRLYDVDDAMVVWHMDSEAPKFFPPCVYSWQQ